MQPGLIPNKRLLEATIKFWEQNVSNEELDDSISGILAEELIQCNELLWKKRKPGGSVPGKSPNIDRGVQEGARQLFNDYFSASPTYDSVMFRRRYRMSKALFLRIHNKLVSEDPYFPQKRDATGLLGCSALQKTTAAMRQLCYNTPPDALDENLRVSKTVAADSLEHFVNGVVEHFGSEYLRAPNEEDIARICAVNKARGFSGMWGSLDCMHWVWDKCPKALQGMYKGKEGKPTVILEAVASQDTWIWHSFFGMPGTLNDINVLNCSPFLVKVISGDFKVPPYILNNSARSTGYFLADGIYPSLSCLVKTIANPTSQSQTYFAQRQEGERKDVERAFGILQRRFWIIAQNSRFWLKEKMAAIMKCCIILHNMIIEDERAEMSDKEREYYLEFEETLQEPHYFNRQQRGNNLAGQTPLLEMMDRLVALDDAQEHFQLRHDLIVHLWANRGKY